MRLRNHVLGPHLLSDLGPTGVGANTPRPPDPSNIPEGWSYVNGTWIKTDEWQNYDGSGYEFHNTNHEFRLAWLDQHMPDPRYRKTDLDLVMDGWPGVEDPFIFNNPLVYTEDVPAEEPEKTLPFFTLLPFIYNTSLQRINANTRGFEIYQPGTDLHKTKVWADEDPSHLLPVRATRWGDNYNLTREDGSDGYPLMAAPYGYMEESVKETIRGQFTPLTEDRFPFILGDGNWISGVGGILSNVDLLEFQFEDIDWNNPGGIMGSDDNNPVSAINHIARAESNYEKFPIPGIDAPWEDGLDLIRGLIEQAHQVYMPSIKGLGRSMVDADVEGMTTGGNDDKMWINPTQVNGLPSQTNYARYLKEVCTCYDPSKCPALSYAEEMGSADSDIYPGFSRNTYAGISGQPYCRYKRQPPFLTWLGYNPDRVIDRQWYKFMDVPRRAVEWAGHYKILCDEILAAFRSGGRDGVFTEPSKIRYNEVTVDDRTFYEATVDQEITQQIGQFNHELDGGAHTTIPIDTVLFYYTNAHPSDDPESTVTHHLASRIYTRIWYIDEDDAKQSAIVELCDNYVVPWYRETCFYTKGAMEGGYNPQIRDLSTRGVVNGGMRKYYEYFFNEMTGIPHWRLASDERDINPQGFHVVDGNDGQPVWFAGRDADEGVSAFGRQYMQVPDARAQGYAVACGYPGEVIDQKMMFWTGPTHPRREHIQELYHKLHDYSFDGRTLDYYRFDHPFVTYNCSQDPTKIQRTINNETISQEDLITIQMIQSTRNLVLPMRFIELNPRIRNDAQEQDWVVSRPDEFTGRKGESTKGTIKRLGFQYPACFCYMRQTLNEIAVEDNWIQKSVWDGLKRQIKRFYYPNSAKWWFDNGLIGCGIETGDPANAHSYSTWPRKGDGFLQRGNTAFSLWSKYIPQDKEIAAAYLAFRPSTVHYIDARREAVGAATSGLTRFVPGNDPFENQFFPNTSKDEDVQTLRTMASGPKLIGIELYALGGLSASYYGADNPKSLASVRASARRQFEKAYSASKEVLGSFDFYYRGLGRNTAPAGGWAYTRLFWFPYNFAKTRAGLRLDCRVIVNGKLTGTMRNYGLPWYKKFIPLYKQGLHTKDQFGGVWNRNDMDEPGSDANDYGKGKGYGFACGRHLGGWAAGQRIFDVTDIVRQAFISDRKDAEFEIDVFDPTLYFEPVLLSSLEKVSHEPVENGPYSNYLEYGPCDLNKRVVTLSSYPLPAADTTIFDDEPPVNPDDEVGWETGNYAVLVLDLKASNAVNTQTSDREDEFLVTDIEVLWEDGEEFVPPESWTLAFGGTNPAQDNRVCVWDMFGAPGTGLPYDAGDLGSFAIPARYVILRVRGPAKLRQFKVYGYGRAPGKTPYTGYPCISTFKVTSLKHLTSHGPIPLYVLPTDPPMVKPYAVQLRMKSSSAMHADAHSNAAPICIDLQFKGYYQPNDPPRITWANGYPASGEFAIDIANGDIIIESMQVFKGSAHENINGIIDSGDDIFKRKLTNADHMKGYEIAVIYATEHGSVANAHIKSVRTGPHDNVLADSIIQFSKGMELALQSNLDVYQAAHAYTGQAFEYLPFTVNNDEPTWGGGKMAPDFPVMVRYGEDISKAIAGTSEPGRNNPWKDKVQGTVQVRGEPFLPIPQGDVIAPSHIQKYDHVTGEALSNGMALSGSKYSKYDLPNGANRGADIEVLLDPDVTTSQVPLEPPLDGETDSAYNRFRKKQVAFEPVLYISVRERSTTFVGQSSFGTSVSEGS